MAWLNLKVLSVKQSAGLRHSIWIVTPGAPLNNENFQPISLPFTLFYSTSVRISPTHPVIFQSQTSTSGLCSAICTLLTILPWASLEPLTSTLSYLSNLGHLIWLNVILPPPQVTSRSSRPSRPATQEHHHVDCLLSARPHAQTTSICAWTLFVGVWLDFGYQ